MAYGNDECVGCGKYCDLSCHHCDEKKINRVEAALKAAETRREEGTTFRTYSGRLTYGFSLLAMAGDR